MGMAKSQLQAPKLFGENVVGRQRSLWDFDTAGVQLGAQLRWVDLQKPLDSNGHEELWFIRA